MPFLANVQHRIEEGSWSNSFQNDDLELAPGLSLQRTLTMHPSMSTLKSNGNDKSLKSPTFAMTLEDSSDSPVYVVEEEHLSVHDIERVTPVLQSSTTSFGRDSV